ncbi:hypothetical protein G9A89_008958 [Geosiphon pyriformis]|nr:hypothetical protein G9A89_008958 [Geosiphon pyriformis]
MKYNPVKFNREVVKRFWQQGYRSPTEISRKTNVPLRSCERYIGQLRKNGQIRAIHRSGRPRKTLPKIRRQIGKIKKVKAIIAHKKNISQAIFITIVEEEWNNLSNEAILNCITSMQNRIQDCISVKGGHTKY